MSRLKTLWRTARLLAFAATSWLGLLGTRLALAAEEAGKEAEPRGSPYVGPYFVVALCVLLGLFIVCNPSRRRERAKPEQYEDRLARKQQ